MVSGFLGKKLLPPESCWTFPSGTTMCSYGKFLNLKVRLQKSVTFFINLKYVSRPNVDLL